MTVLTKQCCVEQEYLVYKLKLSCILFQKKIKTFLKKKVTNWNWMCRKPMCSPCVSRIDKFGNLHKPFIMNSLSHHIPHPKPWHLQSKVVNIFQKKLVTITNQVCCSVVTTSTFQKSFKVKLCFCHIILVPSISNKIGKSMPRSWDFQFPRCRPESGLLSACSFQVQYECFDFKFQNFKI